MAFPALVLALWGARWKMHIVLAIVAMVGCGLAFPASSAGGPSFTDYAPLPQRVAFAACYSLTSACWILGIIGFGVRFLSAPSRLWRYLADASYWVYLVHYPVVVVLQDVLAPVQLHWSVKFPAIVLVTMGFALLSYEYCVRYTFIGRALNGSRPRPGKVAVAQGIGLR